MEYESPPIIHTLSIMRGKVNEDELEKLRYELAETTVDWLRKLHEARAQMLRPKDKDMTELDRKTLLDSSVAVIERDYEFLLRLEGIVRDRITRLNPES